MENTKTLYGHKNAVVGRLLNPALGVLLFAAATVLGSYVRIPVPGSPVPVTLQTLFVLLSGAVLGRRLGAAAQFLAAVPFFPYLTGPTGGYILGFVPAAYLTGLITEKQAASIPRAFAALIAGNAVIYACGAAWLVTIYGLSPASSIATGILPFVAGDAAKICLGSGAYLKISAVAKKYFSPR